MPLKLFDQKRRCLDCLKSMEEITAISGFGHSILLGTSRCRLLIFDTSGPSWENEAAMGRFGSDPDSDDEPVLQICCASALGLVLLVVGQELIGMALEQELRVFPICSRVSRCALNSHPTPDSDPFALQLAICHAQKAHILVGRISADGEFVKERKMDTPGARAIQLEFSGHCLCYATAAGGHFVHNLAGEGGGGGPLKLFESKGTGPRPICTIGMEEFALVSGVQGLIVFVNGQGLPTRAPLSVSGNDPVEDTPVIGLALKGSFLLVLSATGILSIFSTVDDQLQQMLEFPSDEEPSSGSSSSSCHLANIDGALLVLPPSGNCFFELVSVPIIGQIEEQLNSDNFDEALAMMDRNFANFSASEQDILKIRALRRRLAFTLIQRGEFAPGLDLLAKCEVDPRELLLLVARQQPQLGLSEMMESREDTEIPVDEPVTPAIEEFRQIPLDLVKKYLEQISAQQWLLSSSSRQIVDGALARLYAWMGEGYAIERMMEEEEDGGGGGEREQRRRDWNSAKFRKWMVEQCGMTNLAAKLAAQLGYFEEAFETWQQMVADNVEQQQPAKSPQLDDCFQTLLKLKCPSQILDALGWLVPIDPERCMDTVQALEREYPEAKCPPERVVELYQQHQHLPPMLLINYLHRRVFDLDSVDLHDKTLALFVECIRTEEGERGKKCRTDLRHFLLFSRHYRPETAEALFGEDNKLFDIEKVLVKAKDENAAVHCLQALISRIGGTEGQGQGGGTSSDDEDALSAAQLLCTRFPTPDMLTTMLTLHLHLSRSDPALRAQIPHILELLDSATSAARVLRSVPDDLLAAPFVRAFLGRHCANRLNAARWLQVRDTLAENERRRAEGEAARRARSGQLRVDEQTACAVCERRLRADDEFVWRARDDDGGRVTHLRCYEERERERRVASEE